jgi:hypothetical protein
MVTHSFRTTRFDRRTRLHRPNGMVHYPREGSGHHAHHHLALCCPSLVGDGDDKHYVGQPDVRRGRRRDVCCCVSAVGEQDLRVFRGCTVQVLGPGMAVVFLSGIPSTNLSASSTANSTQTGNTSNGTGSENSTNGTSFMRYCV